MNYRTRGPGDCDPPNDAAEEAYCRWLKDNDMVDVLPRDVLIGMLLEDTDPHKLDAALREVWAGVCPQAADDSSHKQAQRQEAI